VGSRGPIAKRVATLAVEPVAKAPAPPRTLKAPGRAAWQAVFAQCSSWLTESDDTIVERLASLHDERAELQSAIAKAGRTARGSQGQVVTHPLIEQLRAVEASISRVEQTLGFGPSNRFRLGVTVAKLAQARSSAERVNEMYRRQMGGK
jgi:P27 family predicted phage terminase small subunit